jgi:membrane-associated phospholipid phosphatase
MPGLPMEWVLEFRHDGLTPVFKALTSLGETGFFIAFLALGYWLIQPEVFRRATLILLFTGLVNGTLKEVFQMPRPQLDPLVDVDGWSFPSGHAQAAGTLWTWLALEARRVTSGQSRAIWMPFALLLAAGISFSRVYLGVHTPVDVVIGVGLGFSITVLVWALRDRFSWPWADWQTHARALGVMAWVVAWWAALPGGGANATPAGGLMGFWVASLYERRYLRFTPPRSNSRKAIAGLLGLVLIFGLRVLLKEILAASPLSPDWARFLRYSVLGAAIGGAFPYALVRTGWAESE